MKADAILSTPGVNCSEEYNGISRDKRFKPLRYVFSMAQEVRFRDPAGSIRLGEKLDGGVKFGKKRYEMKDVDILPPSEPTKIICVGRNYIDHVKETNSDVPDRPLLFIKTPNCLAGHRDTITLPEEKDRVDYEAELAVAIGKQCKDVDRGNAMDVVEGFTCLNDISNRDDQRKETNWVRGKAFDNSAPIGPVITSPNSVPKDAAITLKLNDEVRQRSTIDKMVFSVPELIEEITRYMTLEKGDIIATGTPEGIGSLKDGDKVEVHIEGIGSLINHIKEIQT